MIKIPGKLIGKERPRKRKLTQKEIFAQKMGIKTKSRKFYTPKRTQECEVKIGFYAINAGYRGVLKKDENCKLGIKLYYKRKGQPDIDNVLKTIMDGLQGIVYPNDKQVRSASIDILENQKEDYTEIELFKITEGGSNG